jgi:hypothetical protein
MDSHKTPFARNSLIPLTIRVTLRFLKLASPQASLTIGNPMLKRSLAMLLILPWIIATAQSQQPSLLEKHIGLYKVVSSQCKVPEGSVNPCETTLFLEVVKDHFKVNTGLSYVFWSGDPNIDPYLQYEAHSLSREATVDGSHRLWLRRNDNTQAYFKLRQEEIAEYFTTHWPNDKRRIRHIYYKLQPVSRDNLPSIYLNYPEKNGG